MPWPIIFIFQRRYFPCILYVSGLVIDSFKFSAEVLSLQEMLSLGYQKKLHFVGIRLQPTHVLIHQSQRSYAQSSLSLILNYRDSSVDLIVRHSSLASTIISLTINLSLHL